MKDIYVKFDSPAIKGESQDKDHKDWIEINSWSQAISQPRSATASTAGGLGARADSVSRIHDAHRTDIPALTGTTVLAPTCMLADALTKIVLASGDVAHSLLARYGASVAAYFAHLFVVHH